MERHKEITDSINKKTELEELITFELQIKSENFDQKFIDQL